MTMQEQLERLRVLCGWQETLSDISGAADQEGIDIVPLEQFMENVEKRIRRQLVEMLGPWEGSK